MLLLQFGRWPPRLLLSPYLSSPFRIYFFRGCSFSFATPAAADMAPRSNSQALDSFNDDGGCQGRQLPSSSSSLCSSLPSSLSETNTRLKGLIKSGHLRNARHMFDGMPHKDVVSWTIIISGYVAASDPIEALFLFSRMWAFSPDTLVKPDPFVLSVTLKACASSSPVHIRSRLGQPIHAYAIKCRLDGSVFVASALLDMYAKANLLPYTLQVFDEMPLRNVVTWTAVVTALAHAGRSMEAIRCFADMRASRVTCDSHTFAIALKACADMGQLASGQEIHTQAVRLGFNTVPFVVNALSALYSKCGKIESGLILFDRMKDPDVVSWTTTISTLAQTGREEQAIRLFVQMLGLREGSATARPNEYTFAAIISACAGLSRLSWGEQLHALAIRSGTARSLSVSNATMSMYARVGCLESATTVFHEMMIRDMISWTAIISGHAQEGLVEDAFTLFSRMQSSGTEVNEYVFASLLSACAQMAMLEQGRQLHSNVISAGLELDSTVSSSLVNMYSKCGCLEEARQIFDSQGTDNVVSWTSMINGYADHGHSTEAINLFERMHIAGLKPDSVAFIGVLSACNHAGLVDLGLQYFDSMMEVYGISPEKEHFGCMVGLLCQAGRLIDAERMIESMPFKPDDVVWSILLQACKIHRHADCAKRAAAQILDLKPDCAGTLVAMSNIYADKGSWRDVAEMRVLMRSKGVRKEPGSSWITIGECLSVFVAGDRKHRMSDEIYVMLDFLVSRAKIAGYIPDFNNAD